MIHLLQDEIIELRKTEIRNLKDEIIAEKDTLEQEILNKTKEVEKLRVRCQIFDSVKDKYFGESMKGFEDNFVKPTTGLYDEKLKELESLRNQYNIKIQQIENVIDFIDNILKK